MVRKFLLQILYLTCNNDLVTGSPLTVTYTNYCPCVIMCSEQKSLIEISGNAIKVGGFR